MTKSFDFQWEQKASPSHHSLTQDDCKDKCTADTFNYKVYQAVEQEEIPNKENIIISKLPHTANSQLENIVNIISQLSSVCVPNNRTSCNKQEQTSLTDILPNIMSLLTSIIPEDVTNNAYDNLNDSIWDDSTLQELLDKRNIQLNDLDLNGILDIQDPYVFAAGAKNNPDGLTQGQMFKAKDQEKFLNLNPQK